MSRSTVAFLLHPILWLAPASAQDAPKPPAKDERAPQLLREAIQKMAGLPSFSVRTTENHKDPIGADMGIPGGGAEERVVEAVFGPDFSSASIDDGDHEVVFHHGRMAAKTAKGSWVLRRGLLAEGEEIPFIVDPASLWSVLDRLAGSATSGGPDTVRDVQVETVKLDVSGDLARELTWTGALPLPKSGLGRVAFFAIGGGGGFKQPPPDLTYQLEIAIDPGSRLIQRIKASAQRLDAAGGGHVIFGMGGGPIAEEEEAAEEAKEKGEKPKEKEGDEKREARPIARTVTVFGRAGGGEAGDGKKAKPSLAFQMSFRDHGTAKPSVPDAARAAFQVTPAAAEKSDK